MCLICQFKKKKSSFENALVEKSKSSTTNNNGLVEGMYLISNPFQYNKFPLIIINSSHVFHFIYLPKLRSGVSLEKREFILKTQESY